MSQIETLRYRGRDFSPTELDLIRGIILQRELHPTRKAIARAVYSALGWVAPDGRTKVMACADALLQMNRDGLIELPPPANPGGARSRPIVFTPASDPGEPLVGHRGDLRSLQLIRVSSVPHGRLWRELIARYHYLGYQRPVGAQLRYLIYDGDRLLGAIGFAGAAWKVACRDRFIGWDPAQREAHLYLVANNTRFLIVPWVRVKYLASSVLSLAAKRILADWPVAYGYRPVLLETFCQRPRFPGTCYRAANWTWIGLTRGRGKYDRHKHRAEPIKDVFVYPLHRDFRRILRGERP